MQGDETTRRLQQPVIDHLKEVLSAPDAGGSPAPPAPEERLGRYRILEVLGRGGFGIVYRAEDTALQRPVALKVCRLEGLAGPERADAEARVLREARTAARLEHPHILQVHDVGQVDDRMYLAAELIEGTTLAQAAPELPRRRRIEIARDVARALQYAHGQGVLHRDVKPGNVLLSRDGRVVLADFGLARDIDPALRLTPTGVVAGTPGYVSPEQLRGDPGKVDTRSDLYSLGVVLFELVTGRLPFERTNAYELLRATAELDPPAASTLDATVDRDLEAVLAKALERDRARRYQTAAEFAADLEALLAGQPVTARREGPARWLRRRGRALAAVGALAATIALAALPSDPVPEPMDGPAEASGTARAEQLTLRAEEVLLRVGKRRAAGDPQASAADLAQAEKDLQESLRLDDSSPRTWLALARCQGRFLGRWREAVETHRGLREKRIASESEQAAAGEVLARVLLLVADSLPGPDGFELARLAAVPGFAELVRDLEACGAGEDETARRWRAVGAALSCAGAGDVPGALKATRDVIALEARNRPATHLGPALVTVLQAGTGGGAQARLSVEQGFLSMELAGAAAAVRSGEFAAAERLLGNVLARELRVPPSAHYLLAHCRLAKGDADAALEQLSRCTPPQDQRYAVEYLNGIALLTRAPADTFDRLTAVDRFTAALVARPDLWQASYHRAAAASLIVQVREGEARESRDRILRDALRDLVAALAGAARSARLDETGPPPANPAERSLLRFRAVRTVVRETDPLFEALRTEPPLRQSFLDAVGR